MARDGHYHNSNGEWDEPLIIRNNNKTFNIRLINFQPRIEEFELLDLGVPSHERESRETFLVKLTLLLLLIIMVEVKPYLEKIEELLKQVESEDNKNRLDLN